MRAFTTIVARDLRKQRAKDLFYSVGPVAPLALGVCFQNQGPPAQLFSLSPVFLEWEVVSFETR